MVAAVDTGVAVGRAPAPAPAADVRALGPATAVAVAAAVTAPRARLAAGHRNLRGVAHDPALALAVDLAQASAAP